MKNLRYAFKLLIRNKANNLTRLISITLGLFISIVIFSYATYQMSADRFFPDKERIYQLRYSSPISDGNSNYLCYEPMAPLMEVEFPQIEAASRIYGSHYGMNFNYEDKQWYASYFYVDSAFFEVLDYGVISGDPRKIFVNDNNIMVSESFAKKVFGDENPIGKVFDAGIEDRIPKIVCGVFKDPPLNNHLGQFEMLRSMTTKEKEFGGSWDENDNFPTYIKLRKGVKPRQVEEQMIAFLERHNAKEATEKMGKVYYLSPITRASHNGQLIFGDTIILVVLGLLALFVASLNYILISFSILIKRSKTVGMLKCNGATKKAIFSISLWETAIMILVSLGLVAILIYSFRVPFEQLMWVPSEELFAIERIWSPFCLVLLTFILIGLVDGRMFSKIPITAAFRENVIRNMKWKKTLLFLQILISTTVLTMLIVITKQVDHFINSDRGYELETLLRTSVSGTESEIDYCKSEIEALRGVSGVGLSTSIPVSSWSRYECFDEQTKELLFGACLNEVGYDYVSTVGLEIIYGSDFIQGGIPNQVIVSEDYLKERGWGKDGLGRQIIDIKDGVVSHYTIVGVIKDIQMAEYAVTFPIIMRPINYNTPRNLYMTIRCNDLTPELFKLISDKMLEIFPEKNAEIRSYNETLLTRLQYEISFRNGIMLIASIIIFICLMGLIGFLNDEINRKSKEIAIRKVSGATFKDILKLIAIKMARVSLPAIAIGITASYFAGSGWQQNYMNRIPLSWWLFALGAFFILLIVFGTQILRSWSIAHENPIKRIKTE